MTKAAPAEDSGAGVRAPAGPALTPGAPRRMARRKPGPRPPPGGSGR